MKVSAIASCKVTYNYPMAYGPGVKLAAMVCYE